MKKKNLYIPTLFIAASIILDQVVKYWAVQNLRIGPVEVIPGVFSLTYATNNGAAWSMFAGARWMLIGVTVLAMAAIVYAFAKGWFETELGKWAAYCIIAGAMGNFIDRLLRDGGVVVDLFYFELINFPIFNVADIFVTCGGILFALYVISRGVKDYKEEKEKKDRENDKNDQSGRG